MSVMPSKNVWSLPPDVSNHVYPNWDNVVRLEVRVPFVQVLLVTVHHLD